jgi:hypothetical protein
MHFNRPFTRQMLDGAPFNLIDIVLVRDMISYTLIQADLKRFNYRFVR